MNESLEWPARYVGIPFLDGGRTAEGIDCWGMIRLVLSQECGIDVPSYGEISAHDLAGIAGMVARSCMEEPWVPVLSASKRAFDVVVMRRHRAPMHMGILVCASKMLHVEQKTSAVIVPLDHPSVASRLNGFFRHRNNL